MAGKKKKSLTNKLAKMSDEDRARYLQRKAEMEEEAKRRKEQLIATFMKNKIKKEEVFSRLNLAKINLNWHQILRQIKVKEMKDNVIYLKCWIEQTIEFKNDRIAKLVLQLEEAEEQYVNNFNSHSIHVDEMINDQHEYIEILQSHYEKELNEFIEQSNEEWKQITRKSYLNTEYLKTITHGQSETTLKEIEEKQEIYNKKLYEIEHNNRQKLSNLLKTRGETQSAIWLQLLQLIRMHVGKTDKIRSHLQFLRKMDEDSAEEIKKNEKRIMEEEELLDILKSNLKSLNKFRFEKIMELETTENNINSKFLKAKQLLHTHLSFDETRLRFLVSLSNETIRYYNKIWKVAQQLLLLTETTEKYQSNKEKIIKWLPIIKNVQKNSEDEKELDGKPLEYYGRKEEERKSLTDDEKLERKELSLPQIPVSTVSSSKTRDDLEIVPTTKPKSIIYRKDLKFGQDDTSKMVDIKLEESSSTKKLLPPLKEIEPVLKPIKTKKEPMEYSFKDNAFLQTTVANLNRLENFWIAFGKVQVDVMELKNKEIAVREENRKLQSLIRNVLENTSKKKFSRKNDKSDNRKDSSRVLLGNRSVYSAPLLKQVVNL